MNNDFDKNIKDLVKTSIKAIAIYYFLCGVASIILVSVIGLIIYHFVSRYW